MDDLPTILARIATNRAGTSTASPVIRAAERLLNEYSAQMERCRTPWAVKPAELDAGRAILASAPAVQLAVIRAALRQRHQPRHWYRDHALLSQLARRALPYTLDDVRAILQALAAAENTYVVPCQALLRGVARPLADAAVRAACQAELDAVRVAASTRWYDSAETRRLLKLLDEIVAPEVSAAGVRIASDEWGEQVRPLLDTMEPAARVPWQALLRQCASARGSAPSGKWLAEARLVRDAVGGERFAALAAEWLGAFRTSGNTPPAFDGASARYINRGCLLDDDNVALLRGLAWCCADMSSAALAAVLADAALAGYRKITGIGPRSAAVAGACVFALKRMPGLQGAAQLERVRLGVKQPTYRTRIETALDEAAQREGMTRADLVDMTVPTFDLQDGRRCVAIGSARAELAVAGSDVRVTWIDAGGRRRTTPPADVPRDHHDELKALKRLRDDLIRMLSAQRDRLERLPLAAREWSLPDWRARYHDHPLVGLLARRLIWRFSWADARGAARIADGIWDGAQLVDAADHPLDLPEVAETTETTETTDGPDAPDASATPPTAVTVTLWHPVASPARDVLAWREWLERHQLTQPFKQAHREVYLLTDAERSTRVYSNRFAAHILRQHQFNALCAARGWRNTLRLMVDDTYPPATLELPRWGLRAEFWIEGAGDTYGTDTNAIGTYLSVSTDQVRFYSLDAPGNTAHAGGGGYTGEWRWGWPRPGQHGQTQRHPLGPVPLEQIPALVLSEVLRDIDLFVGVASVGNDPTWQDGGPTGRYRDYWQSYSFGELSATAETRKALLRRLVPRLTIADRCTLDGRFLRVRGDLRTYKIHLGSGNILMEPNDQYLCIVPGRGAGSADAATRGLFLPFEGDAVLAIVLSKALLLAADTTITDPSITRQIGQIGQQAT